MQETFDVHGAIKACLECPVPWAARLLLRCAAQSVMIGSGPARDSSSDGTRPAVKAAGAQSTTAALASGVYKGAGLGALSQRRQLRARRVEAASRGALPRAMDRMARTVKAELQVNPLQLARAAQTSRPDKRGVHPQPDSDSAARQGSDEDVSMSNPLQQARASRRAGAGRTAGGGATQGFGLTAVRRTRAGGAELGTGGVVLRHNLTAAFGDTKRSSMAVVKGAAGDSRAAVLAAAAAEHGARTRRSMRRPSEAAGWPGAGDEASARARSRRRRKARASVLA